MLFRLLTALVFFGFFAHRFYYVWKVRHASGSTVRRPDEPVGPLLLLLVCAVLVAVYAVAPRPLLWASLPVPQLLR